jgi:DNA-binding CsgD family transcriptional regulator
METRLAAAGRRAPLRGRADECGLLDGLLVDVRRGESRSLVLRGEAGIGKTALLEYLVESASDMTVARAVGVESEMELAYASLHQLCGPMLDRLARLPDPQREALEVVFGVSPGPPPDRLLVGLGVLSLFYDVAEERSLLCVVDDAQWLDRASALTLAFVARRLLADPVGIVFAAREPGEELRPLSEIEVRGLVNGDARALLGSVVQSKLDERVRDRIIAETRGNPLALLELPKGLTAAQLAGGFGLIGAEGLSSRIEQSFQRRLETLPRDAQRLLLVAAAEPVGDPLLLWRAAERLGVGLTAAGAVEALLAIDDRVTFRHPLVRSAVYQSASAEDRRSVHRALAEETDPTVDPDRRAWHLAAATSGPDEEVAGELERSAARAQARGGLAAAAAFLQRAVALSADPGTRASRAIAAALTSFQAGAFDVALRLASMAAAGPLDEFQQARVELLRGQVAFASGQGRAAPALLLGAARRLEPFDLDLARDTYLAAWGAAMVSGRYAEPDVMHEICRAAQALPPVAGPPRAVDLLLEGYTLVITAGHAAAASALKQAAQAVAALPAEDILRWGWLANGAFLMLWDLDGLYRSCVRQLQIVRDAGALSELPNQVHNLGASFLTTGDFASASSLIGEAESVAAASGTAVAPYTALRLRALQGREAEARPLMESTLEIGRAAGHEFAAGVVDWDAAALFIGLGRYDEAAAAAQRASGLRYTPQLVSWVLPDLIEAAVRAGDMKLAGDALERLTATTRPSGNDMAVGIEARSRALLSTGAQAERLYRDAVERLGRTLIRPELARAHLLFGEWLRRENRRLDARAQLRTAHQLFEEIGMEAFANRARGELQATGEHVRARAPEARDDLTGQERQIAELARDGLSNPEIGARLFLSPRTVEWHLRKVFGKLDITSRRELATALHGSDAGLVPL